MDMIEAMSYVYKDMVAEWNPSPLVISAKTVPVYKPITITNPQKLEGHYKFKGEWFKITCIESTERIFTWQLQRYASDNLLTYIGYLSILTERDAFGRLHFKRGLPSYTEIKVLPIELVRDMNNIKDLIFELYE